MLVAAAQVAWLCLHTRYNDIEPLHETLSVLLHLLSLENSPERKPFEHRAGHVVGSAHSEEQARLLSIVVEIDDAFADHALGVVPLDLVALHRNRSGIGLVEPEEHVRQFLHT